MLFLIIDLFICNHIILIKILDIKVLHYHMDIKFLQKKFHFQKRNWIGICLVNI